MNQPKTVEEHLRLWGDQQLSNGSGSHTSKGLERDFTVGVSHAGNSIAEYVENTAGFGKAKTALCWVYVALAQESELGEYDLNFLGKFRRSLRAKIKGGPWKMPSISEVLCSWDMASAIAADVTRKVDEKAAKYPSLR